MATAVHVQVSGPGKVLDFEVSGGAEGVLAGTESRDFTIGAQGAMVSFLSLRRVGPGTVRIKAAGKVSASVDGGKDKRGKSVSFGASNNRVTIREAVR